MRFDYIVLLVIVTLAAIASSSVEAKLAGSDVTTSRVVSGISGVNVPGLSKLNLSKLNLSKFSLSRIQEWFKRNWTNLKEKIRQRKQVNAWMKEGKTPEDVFKILKLDQGIDGLLGKPNLQPWIAFLKVYNKKNEDKSVWLIGLLTKTYGDEATANMLELARRVPSTRNRANNLQAQQLNGWARNGLSEDIVFRLLKLDAIEKVDDLVAKPNLGVWYYFFKMKNHWNPDKNLDAMKILRTSYDDIALAKAFEAATKVESTKWIGTTMQKIQFNAWFDEKRTPTSIFKALNMNKEKWPFDPNAAVYNGYNTLAILQRLFILFSKASADLTLGLETAMAPSPTKLRGPTVTTSLEEDVGEFRSISVSDVNDIDDNNDIEVISTTEAEEEITRNPLREEEQPMTKEKRLAFKQMERWRVAMKKRSKRLRRSSLRWNAKTQAYDDEIEFDNLFGSNSTFGREVISYPWPIWTFGVLIMLGASVFVHSVHNQREDDDGHRHTDWWKYLVAVAIYVLGFILIANGRVETFYMNKESSRLSVRSNKPMCLSTRYLRVVERDMRHISNIRVEAAGEYSGDVDTRTYKVHFDFDDGSHVTALESRSKQKTMRRSRHIKAFAAACPPAIAPLRSASEHFSPVPKVNSGSPLRHAITSPAKLSLE
ncbi:unnamed protein product [Phytophthora lilii]|uniref:Unnamed protein product n=1 Tax=Phytophthora lilii TaxID=2077276 RepID=A0A9W6TFS9_9STRA|nr:unnamed protein product [Phytophthora lilii]